MTFRPLHDRIVVRRLEGGEENVGGIIIPESAKERPQRGTVIAVGNGVVREGGTRMALDVKPGDVILFGESRIGRSSSMARTTSSCERTKCWRCCSRPIRRDESNLWQNESCPVRCPYFE